MRYFGQWSAPVTECVEQVQTPVGARCIECGEPIKEGDRGFLIPYLTMLSSAVEKPWHRECLIRTVLPDPRSALADELVALADQEDR